MAIYYEFYKKKIPTYFIILLYTLSMRLIHFSLSSINKPIYLTLSVFPISLPLRINLILDEQFPKYYNKSYHGSNSIY